MSIADKNPDNDSECDNDSDGDNDSDDSEDDNDHDPVQPCATCVRNRRTDPPIVGHQPLGEDYC